MGSNISGNCKPHTTRSSHCQPSAFFQSDLSKEMDLKLGFDEQKHRTNRGKAFLAEEELEQRHWGRNGG